MKIIGGIGVLSPNSAFDALGRVDLQNIPGTQTPGGVVVNVDLLEQVGEMGPAMQPGSQIGDFQVQDPDSRAPRLSQRSVKGPFMFLFNDFQLQVIPHYNFYISDEETNEDNERGDLRLRDVPRYMRLMWKPAPRTDRPPLSKQVERPNKSTKSSTQVVKKKNNATTVKGVRFDREAASRFSSATKSTANGHVTPGVVFATVDLPKLPDPLPTAGHMDEIEFLKSSATEGLSYHELRSATAGRGGLLAAASLFNKPLEDTTRSLFHAVEGTLSLHVDPNEIDIRLVAASSPLVGMTVKTANKSSQSAGTTSTNSQDELQSVLRDVSVQPVIGQRKNKSIEVAFVDPGIDGVVNEDKVLQATAPEHVENIVFVSQFAGNMKLLGNELQTLLPSRQIPSFPAVVEDSGTEYVGYVIEKYKMEGNGAFRLVQTIEIPDAATTEYIDTKVAYGAVYRYRMRSLLRWTRRSNIDHLGEVDERLVFTSQLLSSFRSTYFASEWSRYWEYASVLDTLPPPPPDEFFVRPESHRNRVVVTWKLPDDSQRDIAYFRLFRKLQDATGEDDTGWELIWIAPDPRNAIFFDSDVVPVQKNGGQRYVYAGQTVSVHNEFSKLSRQLSAGLTTDHKRSGELPIRQVSCEGVDLAHRGSISRRPIRRRYEDVVATRSVTVAARQGLHREAFDNKTVVLRLTSLDTGASVDMPISMEYRTVDTRIIEKTTIDGGGGAGNRGDDRPVDDSHQGGNRPGRNGTSTTTPTGGGGNKPPVTQGSTETSPVTTTGGGGNKK